jgi:hypothetical protein
VVETERFVKLLSGVQARTVASAVDAARSRLASFSAANPEAAICERCLQSVTGEHRATSIAAMQADLAREDARYNDCRQVGMPTGTSKRQARPQFSVLPWL